MDCEIHSHSSSNQFKLANGPNSAFGFANPQYATDSRSARKSAGSLKMFSVRSVTDVHWRGAQAEPVVPHCLAATYCNLPVPLNDSNSYRQTTTSPHFRFSSDVTFSATRSDSGIVTLGNATPASDRVRSISVPSQTKTRTQYVT